MHQHRTLKNLLSFLLVLVLTVGTVSALSMATQAKTETAPAQYMQEVHTEQTTAVTELSAAAPKVQESSPLLSVGAFLLLLTIPSAGVLLFFAARKKGRKVQNGSGRRYSPRADMAFSATASVRGRT